MSDYGFVHEGKVFTPNGTQDVAVAANSDRNQAIEAGELARWKEQPAVQLAYFSFPAEELPLFGRQRPYRREFTPCLHIYINQERASDPGVAHVAAVSTWLGTRIGTIISAHVYTHNFGGRFVSLRVRGTNGASYYGRASWDHGQCVWLRRAKGRAR